MSAARHEPFAGPAAPDRFDDALQDALTGLPSWRRLREELSVALDRCRRTGQAAALLHVELTDHRRVARTLGHDVAEELRRRAARRLRSEVRGGELLARVDADAFGVLVTELPSATTAVVDPVEVRRIVRAMCGRIVAALGTPFEVSGTELVLEVAVGAAVFPDDAGDADELARRADAAAFAAVRDVSRVSVHSAQTPDPLEGVERAARLRRAIHGGELELHHQPIVTLPDRAVTGVEALVRWRDPHRGLVPPDHFIPLAESTGLIEPLGEWVIDTALAQAAAWRRAGLRPNLGCNVSPRELRRPGYVPRLLDRIALHGLEPSALILELTESAWSASDQDLAPTLRALRNEGIGLAMDDFGAGYSSLWRLRELPLNIIKLDRALLRQVPEDRKATEVVLAVLRLAEACGADVVAEGVETEEQLRLLSDAGCPFAQGFLLARPAPAPDIEPLLRAGLAENRRGPLSRLG